MIFTRKAQEVFNIFTRICMKYINSLKNTFLCLGAFKQIKSWVYVPIQTHY